MISNASIPITNPQKIQETEEQLIHFLRQHNEVEMILPVIIGVFVTSRFQLRGTNALLVNLAVASLFRQVFATIKNQPINTDNSVATTGAMNANEESESEYTIVHSIPGRIRIKVPRLAEDQEFAQRLQQLLNEDNYVIQVRLNPSAASVIINYDGQGLSDIELGLRLLSIFSQAQGNEEAANVS
ncbi:MAG: metal ABC transporter ATPase [Crocosphaera sp.]|nr:metal ABC transporter ATPase [Crocosphaera sp.]